MDDARAAYRFPGGPRRALLVHGFTGTPFELRPVGEALAARGWTVEGIRLPGHGTTPEDLARTGRREWTAAVADAAARLGAEGPFAVVGQSLGGLLALELAAARPPGLAAIACLATPIRFAAGTRASIAALRIVPGLRRVLDPRTKPDGSDVADRAMKARNPSYGVIPLAALLELDDLRAEVRRGLGTIATPALIVHATHDHVAPVACADELVAGLAGPTERLILPRSYHLLGIDVERARVADAVDRWCARWLPAG
jgi:carboxylesterase